MSRSLDTLAPAFRPYVDKFLATCKSSGLDILVTCTRRTLAEQAALYAQGRTSPGLIVTNAKPGESAHNYGLAIDIVPMINGKPEWSGLDKAWFTAADIGEAVGLEWAGRWQRFREMPHFQLSNWEAHKADGSDD